jgi:hypothetical protein
MPLSGLHSGSQRKYIFLAVQVLYTFEMPPLHLNNWLAAFGMKKLFLSTKSNHLTMGCFELCPYNFNNADDFTNFKPKSFLQTTISNV